MLRLQRAGTRKSWTMNYSRIVRTRYPNRSRPTPHPTAPQTSPLLAPPQTGVTTPPSKLNSCFPPHKPKTSNLQANRLSISPAMMKVTMRAETFNLTFYCDYKQ